MKHTNYLFDIPVRPLSKKQVLDEVSSFLSKKSNEMFHITSLNPEIIVLTKQDESFKDALCQSSLKIVDGVGVFVASKVLNIDAGERYAGVDLMKEIIELAGKERLPTVLIGGKANLALELADCYNTKFGSKTFYGVEVPQNISGMNTSEKNHIISAISALKPRILLVAFGSPTQEKWIEANKDVFKGMVCMGVGGAFDFASGTVRRAPWFVRRLGLEWLFRLIIQPWRIKRQMRLLTFVKMVVIERFRMYDRH